MSTDWMTRFDRAEIPLSPEEEFEQQRQRVARRTQIEADDHVATGDGEEPWWLPWQKTSTVLPTKMTVAEALEHSKLADWNLRKAPLTVYGGTNAIPNYYGVQRETDGKVLGVVQGRYHIISNEEAFDWAQYLLGGDGAMFTSAGSLKGGRIVFMVASTPFKVELPGADKLETYLLISNRHDGSGMITCAIVTVRVVCANTLERSLAGNLSEVRIRHTRSAQDKLAQAQKILGLAQGAADRAAAAAEALMRKKMSITDTSRFLSALLPITEELTPRQVRAVMKRRALIEDVYVDHPTVNMLDESAWRAYNAVTFVNDHLTPRREVRGDGSPEEHRMLAVVNGNNLGSRAYKILAA